MLSPVETRAGASHMLRLLAWAFTRPSTMLRMTHWMWFIFPQIAGLGLSSTSKYYAIKDMDEAVAYLAHPELGARLVEISNALLLLPGNDAHQVFGSPDDMKLQSSMTLFAQLDGAPQVFRQVLDKYFDGEPDKQTLQLVGK
ncbi:uncharacterized protein (DUF1810 family) [Mucilaginibacter yixingensis]|uniref:Uncharacterized protein (DUF1810 family) n=3 Tax=Mucilaginibacter yixingensis TaxID=1295612 RepID=A0A2T5JDS9_9SPHI|nr:uncharacterized protein (DUF1810 family) [Mucilaginibacter yixingensis]